MVPIKAKTALRKLHLVTSDVPTPDDSWEIENQGFNDAKNRHDLEHICHHHPNSLLITWLLTSLALTIERLYRLRYLRRGTHAPRTAADLRLCALAQLVPTGIRRYQLNSGFSAPPPDLPSLLLQPRSPTKPLR